MAKPNIVFINGSIREGSFHGRLARYMSRLLSDRIELHEAPIDRLPLYTPDRDNDEDRPGRWQQFRETIADCDGVLIGSPEYNRSMSGALKNAIDVGSRPYGKGVLIGKPAAVFSTSPGMTGAENGNLSLLPCLKTLNMPNLGQPEAYWGGISNDKIDEDGNIHDDGLKKVVDQFAKAAADWFEKHAG